MQKFIAESKSGLVFHISNIFQDKRILVDVSVYEKFQSIPILHDA